MSTDIRTELWRLSRLPAWDRVQHDEWDAYSDFIYETYSLDDLRRKIRRAAEAFALPLDSFAAYAVRRWYNYHTHQVVLEMFCAHPRVVREEDPRHPWVDFYVDRIPFDLKLTEFPRRYPGSVDEAQADPRRLVNWLYSHQSAERRYHLANRIFVVFHHAQDPSRTWEVRRMFDQIARVVAGFLERPCFFRADVADAAGNRRSPLAGALFCIYPFREAHDE